VTVEELAVLAHQVHGNLCKSRKNQWKSAEICANREKISGNQQKSVQIEKKSVEISGNLCKSRKNQWKSAEIDGNLRH
jgi:hypothetical protein